MEKPATRQPFFSRLLEGQRGEEQGAQERVGEDPPPHTLKYPSDSDETK